MTKNDLTSSARTESVQAEPTPGRYARAPKPGNSKQRITKTAVILQLLAMIGIGALVYSSAADWFATLNHNAEVSGYTQSVQTLEPQEVTEKLRLAAEYNAHMPAGMLRDPYSMPDFEEGLQADEAYKSYTNLLQVSDNGVIGEVNYPRLGIGLPIYHGTNDKVLQKGVGHLFGSSLPIGGPSTHSVLTSHSGLVHAALFTKLPKAKIGDTFTVQVLGEKHWYEVREIETILPEETERLQIVQDKDLVTLFTCTPIGINSHRILVTGERIEAPEVQSGTNIIPGDGKTAGMPWWALIFTGGSLLTGYLLFAPIKPKKRQVSETNEK